MGWFPVLLARGFDVFCFFEHYRNGKKVNKKSRNDPAQAIEVAIFQAGETIIPLGFESPYFFVLLSGQVVLTQKGKRIRTLGELDIFGMESLLLRRPSHYSAEAVQKCRIAKYSPEILDYLIRKSPRMVQNVLSSMVRQLTQTVVNLLEPSPESFEAKDRVLYFSDGEVIRDDRGGGRVLYRLISTEDRVQVTIDGRETMRITNPGEFFGAPILPRSASVRSMGQSVVEKYGADELDIIVRDYPDSAVRIMQSMMELSEAGSWPEQPPEGARH